MMPDLAAQGQHHATLNVHDRGTVVAQPDKQGATGIPKLERVQFQRFLVIEQACAFRIGTSCNHDGLLMVCRRDDAGPG